MKVQVMTITPRQAANWLDNNNPYNRTLTEGTYMAYAAVMRRGDWVVNNQGIGFDEHGNLIDGQHRLKAITVCGTPQKIMVVWGLPRDRQTTVDQGKARSVADELHLFAGVENANVVVAIVRIILAGATRKERWTRKVMYSTVARFLPYYENELKMVLENRKNIVGLVHSSALAAFVFAAKVFPANVLIFETKYFSGENLAAGSPILVFRNYMLTRKTDTGSAYRVKIFDGALNCLMAHTLGTSMRRISSTNDGLEFWAGKQKKVVAELLELVRAD